MLGKVPHVWNQSIWLQVLVQPDDPGQVIISFLFPPRKWGISLAGKLRRKIAKKETYGPSL